MSCYKSLGIRVISHCVKGLNGSLNRRQKNLLLQSLTILGIIQSFLPKTSKTKKPCRPRSCTLDKCYGNLAIMA
ncbi:hypothetical protein PanWU01x14_024470 [Parasponia andersonii]|uniref:Uncharacterized protein n=1 Tax=Parasponia andersonii TaxID=3476 RepID=A0A2P5DWN5_PARAD|nr:hypothetical protein PanWU01x14_024470 [Parasponia andersonii]